MANDSSIERVHPYGALHSEKGVRKMLNIETKVDDAAVRALCDALRLVNPNGHSVADWHIRNLAEAGAFRDLIDLSATASIGELRAGLHTVLWPNEVMLRKSWTIRVDHELPRAVMLSEMTALSNRWAKLKGRELLWDIRTANEQLFQSFERSGIEDCDVGTVRFVPNVGGERVLIELDRDGLDFASFEYMTAFLAENARRLDTRRDLVVTKREFVDRGMRPLKRLALHWDKPNRPILCIPDDADDETRHINAPRWHEVDLLVVKKK
ncbi:hypothetical protein A3D71_01540 [Candidatus Kaiserbacteria bacterium RIFCSPHIGHO2_02_FULL_55_20]|uniref:Uncharacterized protein n=1 Tax=Candidatus Kaiserbacteria bacterium RIFCSPHIGHO2_02_FULL_55_20 TaxID=1798497 RepID=A0A1F6DYU8_9BACT|nr:MAG: hypothetical protein A2680_03685 [Candidatus Kaiserbacteria bacterium RIFCSPHIGHO2_01_FULL_55_37]OGG66182.1 MAG: hypothetical protein A3D71_01540 [Candidatus Kaiserbacteria bacterium RIFCSPHIGHO2_02_FULL_55_20]